MQIPVIRRSLAALGAVVLAMVIAFAGAAVAQDGGLEGRFRSGSEVTVEAGETIQDESIGRLHGQGATTCRPCRSVMRWDVPVPAPAPVRATVATLSR